MEVEKQIRSRLTYLGWTLEDLAIKAHMSESTIRRRLAKVEEFRLGEIHQIEKVLGWDYGRIGMMK